MLRSLKRADVANSMTVAVAVSRPVFATLVCDWTGIRVTNINRWAPGQEGVSPGWAAIVL